jgi:oxygen-independent coproporphyrinogen-3 oxidase
LISVKNVRRSSIHIEAVQASRHNMENMLERAVPRYTSYPTAPHFSSAVDAGTYASWLAALPVEATLSLYLHVPYCTQLCFYCGCHTKATLRRDPVNAYAQRLIEEIVLIGRHAGRRKVVHIHWGGGTPSILGPYWLSRVADALGRTFDLARLREHAIELDPRRLTRELASTLRDIGVNRASLGAQEFNPQIQEAIGRVQPFHLVAEAVAALRERGIDRINLDLMYGLPKQRVEDVERTVMLADRLLPQRIAMFGYAHVPWFKPHQRLIDERDLPSARARLAQAQAAHGALLSLGYQPIGLDHYARPDDDMTLAARSGRLRRNFQGYTTDEADTLVGLGASAIGKLPQGFVQNAPDASGYARAIARGALATVRGIATTEEDRTRGAIIERLMCDLEVDLAAVAGDCGRSAGAGFADEIEALRRLVDEGLLVIAGRRLRVTPKGRPFARLVAAAFDGYLSNGTARHSLAV